MKINGLTPQPTSDGKTARSDGARGNAPGAAGAPKAQGADVNISNAAQVRQDLEQKLAAAPDVDQARVTSIRDAIRNGSYFVDADKVADAFLRVESDLFD